MQMEAKMRDAGITLINVMTVAPAQQQALVALLRQNVDGVIRTLAGWRSSRLIAAADGASVVIVSDWQSPADVAAMRADPRMQAYFPKIRALAELQSIVGEVVMQAEP
jgi:quinol monooxygenase YgiN